MYKGEYLTGDFQTFTVYENGKVVAKRKTRKKVNIVIKLWKSYLNDGKGAFSYAFTYSRKPELEKINQEKMHEESFRYFGKKHKPRLCAIFNEKNVASIGERA
jgi:xylose isomerase